MGTGATTAAGADAAPTQDPLIGMLLDGRYEVERMIGAGGQGVVYLAAAQHEAGRKVVIKMLNASSVSDPEAVARFDREAEQLRSVSHDNIVSMLGYGHALGRAYIVMEYVRGQSLRDLLSDQGPLTLREFVPIAAQVLKAVGHVHSRGIMVRDIKPANIMLCRRRGRDHFVKLLDFGLAKLVGEDTNITTDHVVGTAGFLSPEQIRSEPLDLRVDVFALGVLFYYCLSRQLPYHGNNTQAILYATVNEPPTPLAEALPTPDSIPESLHDLVMQCIAKDREARPAHADEVVEGLIDAVPAAMFKLPKAPGPGATTMTTGPAHLSAPSTDVRPADPVAETRALEPSSSALPIVEPTESRPNRAWLIALASAAVAGTLVWLVASRPPAEVPEANATAPAEAEEPPKDSSPSPAPVEATLEIDFEPSGTIFIDGKERGRDPGALVLEPGKHEVRVEAQDYEPWTKSIDLEAGKAVELQVVLVATAPIEDAHPAEPVVEVEDEDEASRPRKRPGKRNRGGRGAEPAADKAPDAASPAIEPGSMPKRRKGDGKAKTRTIDKDVWGD